MRRSRSRGASAVKLHALERTTAEATSLTFFAQALFRERRLGPAHATTAASRVASQEM